MNNRARLLTGVGAFVLVLGLASCERKGPAEEAGEEIDEAVEEVADGLDRDGPVEDAAEEVEDAIEDAAR